MTTELKEKTDNKTARPESFNNFTGKKIAGIIDHKIALLSVAGAAMKSNRTSCLDRIMPELEEAGITRVDIRDAVESGRFLGAYPEMGMYILDHACSGVRDAEDAIA